MINFKKNTLMAGLNSIMIAVVFLKLLQSLEDQHALRIQLNLAIEGLWTQLQQQLRQFQENTKEKRALFNELRARDFKNNEEISFQHMKILKLEVFRPFISI